MISKIIATFQDGHKVIRKRPGWDIRYFHGLKHKELRPHTIQVFVSSFDEQDKKEICSTLRQALHPKQGKMTINGEFFDAFF